MNYVMNLVRMAQYSTGSTSSSDDSSDDDASRPVPEGSPQTDGSQRSKDGRTETSSLFLLLFLNRFCFYSTIILTLFVMSFTQ